METHRFSRAGASPHGLRTWWIQGGPHGGRLSALGRTQGEPHVLFLHAFAASATYYRWALEAMPDDVAAVAVSLSGHGKSDPPPPTPPLSLWLEEISRTLDALAWPTCVLVGNSAGGGLAVYYAHNDPKRVQGLVLVDASPGGLAKSTRAVTRTAVRHLYEATRPPFRARLVERLIRRQLAWMPPDRARELADESMHTHPHSLEGVARVAWEADLDPLLEEVTARLPLLVVRGARDPFADPRVEPLAAYPGARLVTLPDAGHFPMVDLPDIFADLVTEYARSRATVGAR